jgi:hypothetical protein
MEIGLLTTALIGASLLYWAHTQQRYSAPAGTIKLLFKAAGSADLAEFQKASTPTYYAAFVRYFGEQKYRRVHAVYEYAFQLGMPRWQEYRQRAEGLADEAYRRLHERVATLGREAFMRLSVQERMQLMDDKSKYDAFIFDQGIQALPADERARIDNIEDFRQDRDRGRFAQREAWNLLSDADRAALGSPAVLSPGPTSEKIAFIDRAGISLLDKDQKREIAGIERSELSDADAFKFKYGQPLARDHFAKAKIPQTPTIQTCSFADEELRGSLVRGDVAVCSVAVQAGRETHAVEITLRKVDFRWLVDRVQPDLYEEIPWQVPNE